MFLKINIIFLSLFYRKRILSYERIVIEIVGLQLQQRKINDDIRQ